MHILLLGTSSVGKSSILKKFGELGYITVSCDNSKYSKSISPNLDTNRYYTEKEKIFINIVLREYEDGKHHTHTVYDDVDNEIVDCYKANNQSLFIVLLYASPQQLIDNMFSRRLYDKRSKDDLMKFYTQFYTYCVNKDDKIIDYINKQTIREKLKEKVKYWFNSGEQLYQFVDDFFIKLNIINSNDDDNYPICLLEKYNYDLFINIQGKTIDEVFQEIQTNII